MTFSREMSHTTIKITTVKMLVHRPPSENIYACKRNGYGKIYLEFIPIYASAGKVLPFYAS